MRRVFVLAFAAACYAPHAPANAPCDPASPHWDNTGAVPPRLHIDAH